jgi:predicted phosphodiesterase
LHNKFTIDGIKFWITHIGGKPGKYNPKLIQSLVKNPPDVFICGHSHMLMVKKDPHLNMMYMNPGACGLHGFHLVRTAIRFQIVNSQLTALEIVEWDKKCMHFDL